MPASLLVFEGLILSVRADMSEPRYVAECKFDPIPASDFEDLLLAIICLERTAESLIESLSMTKALFDITHPIKETQFATSRHYLAAFEALEKKYQELDTHYGWVLASDYALVGAVVSRTVCTEDEPDEWMKNIYQRHNKMHMVVSHLSQALRCLVEQLEEEEAHCVSA
jgi:hypothetical protein